MKKFLLALFIAASFKICALPMANPSEPLLYSEGLVVDPDFVFKYSLMYPWMGAFSFRVGYYGDFVFNRNLALQNGLGQGKVIRDAKHTTNAGYWAINWNNRIDLFGTLGASHLRIQTNNVSFALNGATDSLLLTNTHFSWSIGGRAALIHWRCFVLGLEAQYFRSYPKLTTFIDYNMARFNYFNSGNRTRYSEWQAALGLSYRVRTFCPRVALVPYIGVTWSQVRWNTNNFFFLNTVGADPENIFSMKEHKHWGYAIGTSLTLCESLGVTVEGRFANEKAFSVIGEFRF